MRRALAAAVVLFAFSLPAAAEAQADDDPWWGPDKALHFGVSAGLAGGGYALGAIFWDDYAPRLLLGAGIALTLGIAKELVDLAGAGNASWKDMTWNLVGICAGLLIAFLIDFAVRTARGDPDQVAQLKLMF